MRRQLSSCPVRHAVTVGARQFFHKVLAMVLRNDFWVRFASRLVKRLVDASAMTATPCSCPVVRPKPTTISRARLCARPTSTHAMSPASVAISSERIDSSEWLRSLFCWSLGWSWACRQMNRVRLRNNVRLNEDISRKDSKAQRRKR